MCFLCADGVHDDKGVARVGSKRARDASVADTAEVARRSTRKVGGAG
jgi:hypothetical protein